MSNSTRDRLALSPGAKSPRRDSSPAQSTAHASEASPKMEITIQGLDDGSLTMTARLRPGSRTRKVERAIRRYLGPDIQEGDTVEIYRDGEILRAYDRVGDDTQLLHYRVFPARDPERPPSEEDAAPTDTHVAGIPRGMRPFPAYSLEAPTTVAQVRKSLARASGIQDPNTIVVHLVGGPRAGPLEGNDWQLRQAVKWQHREIVVTERPCRSYIILHGCGKEYLWQTPRQDEDGVSVGALKQWLKNTLIRRVHPTLDTQILVDPGDISLYVDNRPLFNDSCLVRWTTQVSFRLSPRVEAAFSAEEKWLCPSFECSLCHETIPDTGLKVSAGCTHESAACTLCIRRWVSTCLHDDGWDKARCPLCSHPLDYNEIKAHSSEEDFERYEMLATKAALGDIPNFYWCLEKGCGSGQIHEPARSDRACPDTLFVCHACKGRQCTRHAVRWHEGRTCQEYDRGSSPRLRQEKASELAIRGVSKRCPGCNRSVSKYVGCNHITCVCGHEWCYLCQATWTQSARTNIPFCKHRAECPERNTNNNPFFAQPRPDLPPEYPDLDGPDDDGPGGWIEAYGQVAWPQHARPIVQPQPYVPLQNRYHLPTHHHPPPMPQYTENQDFGYPSTWTPNPRFYHQQFAEDPRLLNAPPQPLLGPPPAAPRPAGPRHGMRPNSLYAPRPDFGDLAPSQTLGPPVNPRAMVERRRRPSVNWRLPSEFYDREPAEWGQRYPADGRGMELAQENQRPVENQRAYNGVRYAAGGAAGVRRPQVKIPAERGMLARMRSS